MPPIIKGWPLKSTMHDCCNSTYTEAIKKCEQALTTAISEGELCRVPDREKLAKFLDSNVSYADKLIQLLRDEK